MNNPYTDAIQSEEGYRQQAEHLGVTGEHADRLLRRALADAREAPDTNPYELAYLQLVADMNQNPK
ncbi:hypothetical protein FHX81_0430 [Saccharothrix saharensis]|uniref:Uncharacterized protein n=1 Tax=Saccharothrix saharensis TaxID=571190 RepID=A0A543J5Q7_9PSEU|nr:hypothetical protein [Saccharothrix saharensis]TQM78174.1 hypothetical protein FHX81_0430 [Saccharothrix saharensis]